ncbi:Frigida-like protein [Musa troglodytarum]|uniref:FRIGIDA-like protein n=1 Tax=Musa troglodytarum TaxID=320322 RepID=A0A9E7K9G2_9LILI|nr:Frigida-like protein [Musa troglodytarum]
MTCLAVYSLTLVDSMEDTETVYSGIESAGMMLEQLGKAFADLESHKESSAQSKIKWDEINEHFQSLERLLKDKLEEVKVKEKAFEEKHSEAQALIAEKEAAVSAKEHASLARLQDLRDSAVSAIAEARQKYKVASPEPIDVRGSKEKKVSTSPNDINAPNPASEEKNPDNASCEVRPRLKQLCQQMDAKGLLKFILEKKRNLGSLREELSLALKYATEPARLVLESLEGFYPLDQSNSPGNEDNTLQGLRRSCLLVMESAAPLLGSTEQGVNPLSSEIKQQAKEIADKWRPKLAGLNLDASNGYSLEAQAFLQLLATFSIAPEFDEDELCKLVIAVSRRRQAPEFCRSLGLTHKTPGLIEDLVSKGRQIDAVHFAHAFQLTDQFPPVPLLKAYLRDLKDAKETNEDMSTAAVQKDSASDELGAIRAVIKCIEEYKLQEEYPLDPLQKQVAQLEKAKADKKRGGDTAKFQPKRSRASGGYVPRRHAVNNWQRPPSAFDHRASYAGGAERYAYNVPPVYEAPPVHAAYGQQAHPQRAYHYPDERGPSVPYGGATSNYGSYTNTTLHSASNNYANYMGPGVPSASSTYGGYAGTSYQPPHQSYM